LSTLNYRVLCGEIRFGLLDLFPQRLLLHLDGVQLGGKIHGHGIAIGLLNIWRTSVAGVWGPLVLRLLLRY